MNASRTAEWIGIAAGIGLWTASLLTALPAERAGQAPERVADAVMLDPMFVREASAEPVCISGRVVDQHGAPVPGVTVYVYRSSRATSVAPSGVTTDEHGRFRVRGLAPGRYSFVAFEGSRASGAAEDVPVFAGLDSPGPALEITLDDEPVDA